MPQAPAAVHTRTCAPCWSWVSTHNSPARPDCGSWNHEAWHFQQVLEHQQAPGHKPWTTRMPHASSQERKPSSGQDKGMSQENCRQHTWATQPMNPCESCVLTTNKMLAGIGSCDIEWFGPPAISAATVSGVLPGCRIASLITRKSWASPAISGMLPKICDGLPRVYQIKIGTDNVQPGTSEAT